MRGWKERWWRRRSRWRRKSRGQWRWRWWRRRRRLIILKWCLVNHLVVRRRCRARPGHDPAHHIAALCSEYEHDRHAEYHPEQLTALDSVSSIFPHHLATATVEKVILRRTEELVLGLTSHRHGYRHYEKKQR